MHAAVAKHVASVLTFSILELPTEDSGLWPLMGLSNWYVSTRELCFHANFGINRADLSWKESSHSPKREPIFDPRRPADAKKAGHCMQRGQPLRSTRSRFWSGVDIEVADSGQLWFAI
jgi:hypothetical protein